MNPNVNNNFDLQRLIQMKNSGMTPQQVLQQMFGNNLPTEVIVALNQMRTSGLSPQQYVQNILKQQHMDINSINNILSIFK